MVWELKPDCRNEFIAGNIRRKTVDSVLQCLHFRDNTKSDGTDKLYKLRPIFDNLNKSAKWFVDDEQFSINEIIIPYFNLILLQISTVGSRTAIVEGLIVLREMMLDCQFLNG